jgi:predicted glycoside hydrolase/deacetylase ChbG (UPF0249 family)
MTTERTKGEKIVRTEFNPSNNSDVDKFKQDMARLIDFIDSHNAKDPRLAAMTITKLEEAAMLGVKLLTA